MDITANAVMEPPRQAEASAAAPEPISISTSTENGRCKADGLPDADRNLAVLMHVSSLISLFMPLAFFAPLVIWLVRKEKSVFNDDHGREVVNFQISLIVQTVLLCLSMIMVITIPFAAIALVVVVVSGVVNGIRGAIAASNGEFFRYPMTLRFLS